MKPITFTLPALDAADTNAIAETQTPGGAGNLTLTSTAAAITSVLNVPRYGLQLTIDCAGSDAGRTFTVTGTGPGGRSQTEDISGSNGSQTVGVSFWETVTQIAVDAGTAGAVIVGTGRVAQTDWLPLDIYAPSTQTAVSIDITGTINVTVKYTNDDPFDHGIVPIAVAHPAAGLATASTDQTGQATALMRALQLTINSGGGTCRFTATQQSVQ